MMKIMTVQRIHKEGESYIEPVRGHVLFRHCANGKISVTEDDFRFNVKPLLLDHGIEQIEIKWWSDVRIKETTNFLRIFRP